MRKTNVGVPPGHHVLMVGGFFGVFRLKPGLQPTRSFRTLLLFAILAATGGTQATADDRNTADLEPPAWYVRKATAAETY